MSKLSKVTIVIAFAFVLAGAITSVLGWRTLNPYRWEVLKAPIRLEKGLSSTGHFTVDMPAKYYLEIDYHKRMTWLYPSSPTPPDDFSGHFTISSDGIIVAQGSHLVVTAVRPFHTLLYLGPFDAEPGRTYDLSFRINDVLPAFASRKATLMIMIDPHIPEGVAIKGYLVTNLGVALVLVGVMIIALQLLRLTRQKEVLYGALLVGGFLIMSLILTGVTFMYCGLVVIGLLWFLVWQRNRVKPANDYRTRK